MWIVLGAAALIVVLVVVIVAFRRPRADDLHSVRSYHSALGTLENMSDRPGQPASGPTGNPDRSSVGHVRPRFYSRASAESSAAVPGDTGLRDDLATGLDAGPGGPPTPSRRSGPAGSRPVPPVPLRNIDAIEDPATPLVFDDAQPDLHPTLPAAQGSHEIAPPVRLDRAQRHALESMNRRPRRITAVSIVVVVVVVFAVLAVIGSRRSDSPHHGSSASATTSATDKAARSSTSTTVHGAKSESGKKKAKTPTPTTVPTQLVALSSTSTAATYSVASDSYTVTVSASGPCWVAATTVATGSTLWEGTLQAGQVQAIPASGVVTVQLGTTAATIKVGKLPVILPSPLHSPFVATFRTPGSGSDSESAASTTTTTATASTTGTAGTTGTTTSTTAASSAG